jgi:hypothetical protein
VNGNHDENGKINEVEAIFGGFVPAHFKYYNSLNLDFIQIIIPPYCWKTTVFGP